MSLEGKVIAVTGGGGGIGGATVSLLEAQGAEAIALDVKFSDSRRHCIECDVTSEVSVESAVEQAFAKRRRLDGLVAAAGIVEADVAAETMEVELFEKVVAVNLRGTWLAARAVARRLLNGPGGSIVAIASMSGNYIVNYPQKQCAYNASKAAVTALVKSLAVEWGPRGVRVNAVSPGYVATPMTAGRSDLHEGWLRETVLGRMAQPTEIAEAVCWLLDEERSAFCCGTELLIDGGFCLR
jgi:NAD(P)-dependent dehydrogenase (short-subunit alcohol dehydrogenase family)